MKIPQTPKVIIRDCPSYDVPRIRTLVQQALDELGLRPFGRTLVKPNIVASGKQFPHAYTRPEVAEGVLRALLDVAGDEVTELAVGERCGITIPTRYAFAEAGYNAMLKSLPQVKRYCFEEQTQVEVRLTHADRLRDYIFTPQPVAQADFFVNMPKFKAHPWTTVTFSLKNYIGIQDDRHRLIDHDHRLDEKIADLQYVLQPQFICIDGIVAGQQRMLTPVPFDLGLLVMGNSQLATDAVCCRIIGVDPKTVDHIRLVEERGFGSTDLAQIEISGDVSLQQAQARANGFDVGLQRVERFFEGTKISAYAGPPPEPERTDYCWGGCPGAIQEAIEILRQFDRQCDEKVSRMHVVFGAYDGPIDATPDEWVVFIGDCASWSGELCRKPLQIQSIYRPRETKDPYQAKHDDIYSKMVSVLAKIRKQRKAGGGPKWLRLPGCPVSVAEQVLALATLQGIKNPLFDLNEGLRFNRAYAAWRGSQIIQRLRGKKYQRPGPCHRGEAAPDF